MDDDTKGDVEDASLFPPQKSNRSADDIEAAEKQITQNIRDVRYIVREYPVEVVVGQYLKGRDTDENEVYVPDYQRDLIWPQRHQSRFIESVLIGLPIPFLFVADVSDEEDPEKPRRAAKQINSDNTLFSILFLGLARHQQPEISLLF